MATRCIPAIRSAFAGLVLLVGVQADANEGEDPRSRSDFYRLTFGMVDSSGYALAARVDEVFRRLLRVADKAEYKAPRLLLVDSDSWPWAIALPDNTVVLTRGAVEVCYRGVSPEQGDVRLAMILGHELGHLAEDDYWHRDVYLALSDRAGEQASDVFRFIGERSGLVGADSGEWRTIVRDRELRADDRGFIYAALAGYETRRLVTDEAVSFFHYWTEQTSAGPGNYHLGPADRAAYLQARAGTLLELAELYRVGVALTHLGNLEVAEKIFRQVLTTFPAREVYNNLGYIRLQKALDLLSVDLDRLYWFPATVDTTPESSALANTRSITTLESLLAEAVEFFQLALKQDPGYLDAYLNLSTAYFYLGRYNNAAAVLADARQVAPDNAELEVLWQISMLQSLDGSVDYLPVALAAVTPRAAEAGPLLRYNLAQLLERAGRGEEAAQLWLELAADRAAIPSPYREVVDLRLGRQPAPGGGAADVDATVALHFGAQSPSTRDAPGWRFSLSLDGDPLTREGTLDTDGAARYLAGDREFLRRRIPAPVNTLDALRDCCGEPLVRQASGLGEIWRYGDHWAFLVRDGRILEIWQNPA